MICSCKYWCWIGVNDRRTQQPMFTYRRGVKFGGGQAQGSFDRSGSCVQDMRPLQPYEARLLLAKPHDQQPQLPQCVHAVLTTTMPVRILRLESAYNHADLLS